MEGLTLFGHAFGQRYELPIPLSLFVFGGAAVVLLSFFLILPTSVHTKRQARTGADAETVQTHPFHPAWAVLSFVILAFLIVAGLGGSQEVAENIVPTAFWLIIWIAVPLSCGVLGNWTERLNPFAFVARLSDSARLRKVILNRQRPLGWPAKAGWWPATVLFFALACGELVYNQTATRPAATAAGLLVYFLVSVFMGLVTGQEWLRHGEVFSVLYNTWGRLGYFRFGAPGRRGFAGGLGTPFAASPSRTAFVLLLLVSVGFDGLLSTPLWSRFQHGLPPDLRTGSAAYDALAVGIFLALAVVLWALFAGFAGAVEAAGRQGQGRAAALTGLLPSLLPISFGYLLAHNIEYLAVNGQLLLPLIGDPLGLSSWPIHLPYPFNDDYEVHTRVFPSAVYWYFAVLVIVAVHIVAILVAHRHLSRAGKSERHARYSEYPWIAAMVLYTMLSLWLLAQPLVKERRAEAVMPPAAASASMQKVGY